MKSNDITIEGRVIQFTDVHNYSIAVNTMDGNHSGFLQDMYERLGDIIVAHRGDIISYIGDSILSVYPAGSENDVIKCSMELRKSFFDLVKEKALPTETELEIGIGAGRVEIGIIGHRSLRQRDIFGEVVNQTAMIGHHRGIAITEPVYHSIKMSYKTVKLPEMKVKWRDEPLKVWEVVE